MKAINNNFNFHRAYNAEHYEIHRHFLELADETFSTRFGLGVLFQPYSELYVIETDCYLRNQRFEQTELGQKIDAERDNLFLYVSQTITTARLSPIEEVAAAGKRLIYVLEPYKDAPRLNHESNTAAVNDFIEKMKDEKYAEDIATLNLSPALTALEEKNNEYFTLHFARAKELLNRKTSETMKSIRLKVDKAAKEYFSAINAHYQINELVTKDAENKATLEEVIDGINALLIQLQDTISRRNSDGGTSADPDNKPSDDNDSNDNDIPDEPEEDEPIVQ